VAALRNTHPFVRDGRLFAHNGVVKGLDVLESWLAMAERAALVGDTDSERIFAYVSAAIRAAGDVTAGLVAAVTRIAAELPVYALNLLLAAPGRLWALRYPDTYPLWVLAGLRAPPPGVARLRWPAPPASCGCAAASWPRSRPRCWRACRWTTTPAGGCSTPVNCSWSTRRPRTGRCTRATSRPTRSPPPTSAEAVCQSPYTTGG
jgi:Glutamine amidotransferases class-II